MKKLIVSIPVAVAMAAPLVLSPAPAEAQCTVEPRTSCASSASFLSLRKRDVYRDRIYWKWEGDPGTLPTGTARYALCLYERDADGTEALVLDWGLSSSAGWTNGRRGSRYRHRRETSGRAVETSVRVVPEKGIAIRILGPNLPLPTLPVEPDQVRVQFVGDDGTCWESVMASPALRSGPQVFWDSTPR